MFFPNPNTSAYQVILKSLKVNSHSFRKDTVNFQLLHFGRVTWIWQICFEILFALNEQEIGLFIFNLLLKWYPGILHMIIWTMPYISMLFSNKISTPSVRHQWTTQLNRLRIEVARPEVGRLDSLIMLMLFMIGFYRSTNVQKSLEAALKWLKKQRVAIRKKTFISPDRRRMKPFKMQCIRLSRCKIHLHIVKKNL